jgi:hypothetical protein
VLAVEAAADAGRPTASSSSMKMIAGAFLRASSKSLRIRAAPRPGEHLDERRGALRVEVRARTRSRRPCEQRLARSRRAVQQDAARHPARALEALAVAEELDDLLELRLRLVEPGDVRPRTSTCEPRTTGAGFARGMN